MSFRFRLRSRRVNVAIMLLSIVAAVGNLSAAGEPGVKVRFVLPQPTSGKVSLRVGDFVDIACEPYGYPLPVLVGWTKGNSDELIGQNDCDKRVLSKSSGASVLHLFIESLLKSDSGEYFCLAKAGSKSVNKSKDLPVETGPIFYSQVFTAKEFGSVRLVCAGINLKSVQWKFAGIQIETRHPYRLDGLYGQFLDIVNVTREHAGVYECSSTSSWYGGSGNQTLVVEYPAKIIGKWSERVTVARGVDLNVTCTAEGHPRPLIAWQHKGRTISSGLESKFHVAVHGNSSRLAIFNVTMQETGMLTCYVVNYLSFAQVSMELWLKSDETGKTCMCCHQSLNSKASLTVKQGSRLEISCHSEYLIVRCNLDTVTFEWLKDGQSVENQNQTLIVPGVVMKDAGVFVCLMRTNREVYSKFFSVEVDTGEVKPPTPSPAEQTSVSLWTMIIAVCFLFVFLLAVAVLLRKKLRFS